MPGVPKIVKNFYSIAPRIPPGQEKPLPPASLGPILVSWGRGRERFGAHGLRMDMPVKLAFLFCEVRKYTRRGAPRYGPCPPNIRMELKTKYPDLRFADVELAQYFYLIHLLF